MSIASVANVRRRWLALVALIAVVAAGSDLYRLAPKFEGKVIPEPPSQGQAWTAPATRLPRFLVNATGFLFEQGVADPRGCEYRLVEISNGSIVKARDFVLPERADAAGRFVVCWDGLVYPALTVGDPVDLDRDIKDLAANSIPTATSGRPRRSARVTAGSVPTASSAIMSWRVLRPPRSSLRTDTVRGGT